MKIRAVDFIMIQVGDLGRAAGFYRDILGLTQTLFSEEYQWAEFDCGNVTLALKGRAIPAPDATCPRLAFAVADLDVAYAELAARHILLSGPPEDHGVCRHLDLVDPDGHPLILHQRADGTCG